jgi:hypothetical protein
MSRRYIDTSIVLVLSLLFSGALWAEKLYKIVDEHGNVTFSQFPPKEKSENTVVEGVEVQSVGGMDSVRQVGNSAYCGDIRLPTGYKGSSNRSSQYRAEYIQASLEDWREDLQRVEQQSQDWARDKFTSRNEGRSISNSARRNSSYQKQLDYNTKRMRALRCAINWAENKGDVTTTVRESARESTRLQNVHENLEAQMIDTCGREPLLDPTDPRNAKDRRQWKACSKQYRKKMGQVESELYRR